MARCRALAELAALRQRERRKKCRRSPCRDISACSCLPGIFICLTAIWTLAKADRIKPEELAARHPKLEYNGLKKQEGRELHELRYRAARGAGDTSTWLYFDPAAYRHVQTRYKLVVGPQMPAGYDESPKMTESTCTLVESFDNFEIADGITLPPAFPRPARPQAPPAVSISADARAFAAHHRECAAGSGYRQSTPFDMTGRIPGGGWNRFQPGHRRGSVKDDHGFTLPDLAVLPQVQAWIAGQNDQVSSSLRLNSVQRERRRRSSASWAAFRSGRSRSACSRLAMASSLRPGDLARAIPSA
jgi:hypothetical protein